ncbi:hypothetical protein C6Y40_15665 [Alteromonas alba]|uniref:OmpR/PhoB-type domain-containing protein n=1 Tax=Alteromonas alba TaxID=2079529 RepID=A0A2S9V861_9ALTE|nr:winged helix-turn-helix domain-containing protein [Alteromonas alba]PRO72613.1 hypothetical protein C6Y40_15665 [Alteromonas alba]
MTYDKPSRTITDSKGEQRVLSPQCGDLLDLLMENEGEIVTRADMRQSIWGHKVVSEDRINHLVCRLRKELKSLPEPPPWQIEVIPKRGYRLTTLEPRHNIPLWLHRWIDWVHDIIR